MLHLLYWSQSFFSVEHAVTVKGPSIASMTSATLIAAGGRPSVYPPRVPCVEASSPIRTSR